MVTPFSLKVAWSGMFLIRPILFGIHCNVSSRSYKNKAFGSAQPLYEKSLNERGLVFFEILSHDSEELISINIVNI